MNFQLDKTSPGQSVNDIDMNILAAITQECYDTEKGAVLSQYLGDSKFIGASE